VDKKWQQVREIFDSALSRKPEERSEFVIEACGGDETLLSEVESLLSSLNSAESFLDTPVVANMAEVIEPTLILERGRHLGHYEIIRQIGEGGMGTVYLGRDTKLDRPVAIKVLNNRYGRQGDNIRRFVQEAKAASALNHPNILTIFEIGEIEGSHYIVSEYIEGRTLREMMKSEEIELPKILDIVGQTASALAAAHKARIVHRDIKPENIIVRDDGYVKVLDFGLAKLLPENPAESIMHSRNSTASGMILGTVNYMSPEQAKGERVDGRTDIFSLGAVLYEMITGKAPFAGDSIPETFAKLIEREPEPIRTYVSGVPDEIVQIISRMLEKDPQNRFQSVSEAAEDLKAIHTSLSGTLLEMSRQRISENRTAVMQQTTRGAANTTAENTGPSVPWYRRLAAMVTLGVLLLGSIGLGAYFWRQRAVLFTTEIRSVAVMPFLNESGNPDVEYLSDGMTDTLIGSLSELPNIKVKARTSVFRYKGKEIDPKAIGRELGVQAIVNGRVAQRDGRTSVSLEVIDTETEDVIFSKRYNELESKLVTLQSDMARDVSGKLESKLSGAEEAKVTKTHTADPEALQLYLQGQFYRYKGGRGNLLRATGYYSKAIEKDPNYALAYAGLALNYKSYDFYNLVPDSQKASAAAKRALELDDSLAEAHVAAGQFRRAIELNPDYADAHVGLCIDLTMTKRFDEGITECSKARELDPSSAIVTMRLGAAYFFARRPDEAIEMFTRAREMDPTLWVPLGYLGGAQTLKGQYTEAAATFRKAIEISDGSPNAKSHLAYALAKAGQRDEALKMIDELKRLAEREHINTFHFAVPYIGLGDKDEAFFWLGKGIDEGSIGFAMLDVHPWFDDLRSDPRFTALLNRAKPPQS
jgi:eukaryotic-like serine/threonine-protein kinase